MFYSNELLHLVFADKNDTYYYNGLFALDLNETLWFLLHKRGFDHVYFLEFKGDDCQVAHYGDRNARDFRPEQQKKKLFFSQKTKAEKLGEWLERELRGSDGARAAAVCSFRAFCRYFEAPDRCEILRRLAGLEQRTGILVLTAPPETEATKDLFLHSPVFPALDETGIVALRTAKECHLYRALSKIMGERCTYLNQYTEDRLLQLTQYLLLTEPAKSYDFTDASLPAAYLFQYLNNEAFRAAEEAQGVRLPGNTVPFRRLYDSLRRPQTWKTVVRRVKVAETVGGLRDYCAAHGLPLIADLPETVGARHKTESYAGRCLSMELAPSDNPAFPAAEKRLRSIRKAVSDPRNRDENPEIVAAMEQFLTDMFSAASYGDVETQYRILEAISFCLQWLYALPGSEDEEKALRLIDTLNTYLSISEQYYDMLQAGSAAVGADAGKLEQYAALQVERHTQSTKKMLDRLQRLLRTAVMKAALPSVGSMEEIENELRAFTQTGLLTEAAEEAEDDVAPFDEDADWEGDDLFSFDPDAVEAASSDAAGNRPPKQQKDAGGQADADDDFEHFEFVLRDGIDERYRPLSDYDK